MIFRSFAWTFFSTRTAQQKIRTRCHKIDDAQLLIVKWEDEKASFQLQLCLVGPDAFDVPSHKMWGPLTINVIGDQDE